MKKTENNRRAEIILRYAMVSLLITVMAFAIVYKLVRTTIIDAPHWNAKAERVMNTVLYEQPRRGNILACDGSVLATTITKYEISLDYRSSARYDTLFVKKLDSLCMCMAEHYPTRTMEEWRDYLAAPLKKAPKERKKCHMLLKEADKADYDTIMTFPYFRDLKKKKRYAHGLCSNPREVRIRPYKTMAQRSIGRCNYRHEAKFEGASRRKDSIDVLHGYSGLEYALDKLLYGERGIAKYETVTHGVRRRVVTPPVHGKHVRTTIDINMQDFVENELQDMLAKTEAEWGACIMMEVATGDIKAISNLDRDEDGRYIEAMNYVVQGYEPGSVMKPISMVVALENKFAGLDQVFSIGRSYSYGGGRPISDTHSPAALPVRRFIEYSSNIGMTKLIAPHYADNLNGFRESLREIGFLDSLGTGMAGERRPYLPTLNPKAGGHVSLSRMTYGYSTQIPPLYTCAIYNAIANKGHFVRPRLYSQLIDRDGTVTDLPVDYVRENMCSEANAKALMEMLHSVVYGEGGTAKTLRNDRVCVVGKTGTCIINREAQRDSTGRVIRPGGYREGHYRLAFCGIFPYENPKYTCMVLISDPSPAYKGAANTAGMVVRNIAYKMYAHGMLDSYSDFRDISNPGTEPVIYACEGKDFSNVRSAIGASKTKRMRSPQPQEAGQVPDVCGLGLREALACIEDAGYVIEAHGSGFAVRQEPEPGSPATPGQAVKVTFKNR